MSQEYEKELQDKTYGMSAIRKSLEDKGYDNIGYNEATGMVTIGGVDAIKPDYMDERLGRSYASEQTIANGLSAYHTAAGDPMVRFADRVAARGGAYGIDANSIGFSDGKVSVGGQAIQPEYIDESGKAWTAQSVADRAVERYIEQSGLKNPAQMYRDYQRGAQRELNNNLRQLQNRQTFSYDPAKDEVFQSYLRQYELEGNRAAEGNAATIAARTGGYMNSAAVTAAAQARNYYSQKAMSALPEFAEQAYQRYLDDYSRDVQAYERKRDLYETDYDRAVTANTALRDNLRYAAASDEERNRYYMQQQIANANADLQRHKLELEIADSELDYQMKQQEAEYYPTMLQYDAMLQYQKWMQGDTAYQKERAELREKQITADYAAMRYEAELRYKNAQIANLNARSKQTSEKGSTTKSSSGKKVTKINKKE